MIPVSLKVRGKNTKCEAFILEMWHLKDAGKLKLMHFFLIMKFFKQSLQVININWELLFLKISQH